MKRVLAVATAAACTLAAAPASAPAQTRARFDVRLIARVPPPGYPAMAYVHPNGRIYAGTYVNPRGDGLRSRVFEYDLAGTLLRSWTVPGQDLSGEHGTQVGTSDSRGRLVLLDRSPARALLLDRGTGGFSTLANFPDLTPCPPGQARTDCSPTLEDHPPVPNYGAWAPDGGLYVTDYLQGVVWRVPPGGGAPTVWLSDRRLDGGMFGTTGIALAADRRTLLVAQGSSAGLGGLNPATGKIYSVPILPDGKPGELKQVYESGPTELPDGFAIARSGRLYVPLAGTPSQIAVVAPDGREIERIGESGSGANGSEAPFDTPSSARFAGTSIVVPNQSFATGDSANQTLLDVETKEAGLPEFIPGDRVPPVLSRVSLSRKRLRPRRGRGTRIRYRLSEPARVHFGVERRRRGKWRRLRTFSRRGRQGRNSARFSGRVRVRGRRGALRRGRYRVVLRARDGAGNRSRRVARRFTIAR